MEESYNNYIPLKVTDSIGLWGELICPLDQNPIVESLENHYEKLYRFDSDASSTLSENGSSSDGSGTSPIRRASVISLSVQDYKNKVADILEEFFTSFDCVEASCAIMELENKELRPEVVKKCVSMAMDRRDKVREAISQLLFFMHRRVLNENHMVEGFCMLLSAIDDLAVDVPHATLMLAQFIARAVKDSILPAWFISKSLAQLENERNPEDFNQCEVLRIAEKLCNPGHGASFQLNSVWGPGDGRPVARMKDTVDVILREFLLVGDVDEAVSKIMELDAPHFYHEVVKRAIRLGLDRCPQSRKQLWGLVCVLHNQGVVSTQQIALGFQHLFATLDDILLDTPGAEKLLFEALAWAKADKCMDDSDVTNLMV